MNPGALLLVLSEPPPTAEATFSQWYDEHASARLTVPGMTSAQRSWSIEDDAPRHLAIYDLESLAVLDSPPYKKLRNDRPPGEEEMIASLPAPMDRRTYLRIGDETGTGDVDPSRWRYMLAVWMSVRDPDNLNRWYDEEHAPALLQVPGWLRCRRFELVEGNGPRLLALHDLATLDVFHSGAYAQARNTPWRRQVVADQTEYERRIFKLHRNLVPPPEDRG